MKPIYSSKINIQLACYNENREEWILAFFDVDQDFTMMYICSEQELLELSDNIREAILDKVRNRDEDTSSGPR